MSLYMANKVNFACSSTSIGGSSRKRQILHFPRMRYKRCRLGCHRSIMKVTLLGEQSTFRLFCRLLLEEIPASFTLRTFHHENSQDFMESIIGYASLESWELTMLCGVRYCSCSCSYEILGTHYVLWSQIRAMFLSNHENSLGFMKYVLFLSNPANSLGFMKSDIDSVSTESWELTWLHGVRYGLYFYRLLRTQ